MVGRVSTAGVLLLAPSNDIYHLFWQALTSTDKQSVSGAFEDRHYPLTVLELCEWKVEENDAI